MAKALIAGRSLTATKNASDYRSDGSHLLTPILDASLFSGEMIAGSLFQFSPSDATNQVFAQLALAYRQQKSVVVAIDAGNTDIGYIDSTLTQLLLNKDGTFAIYNPDFERLAKDAVADVSIRFLQPAASNSPTLVVNTTSLKVTGTNEAPLVAAALESQTTEDTDSYDIDLLRGASDIDHGAVLNAVHLAEASGNTKGWSLVGNAIDVDPSAYGYLNDGESKQLNFTYEVMDEHGAVVAQSLSIDIEGITDAPTLVVTTSAGNDANEVILHVTSTQAAKEQVKLAFLERVLGGEASPDSSGNTTIVEKWVPGVDFKVYDASGREVTNGIENFFADGYTGSHDFKVVFNDGDVDLSSLVKVEVTGIHPAHGDYPYKELANLQSIELNYDVNETQEQEVTFSNSNLNMWGNWGSPVIEWHEYLPVLGNDFMQWHDGAWQNEGVERWNSGTITLADVSFNSSDITDEALVGLKAMRDVALTTLTEAQNVYEQIKEIPQVIADYDYAKGIENTFNAAKATLNGLESALSSKESALRTAVGNAAYDIAHKLDGWYVSDWGNPWVPFDETWAQETTLGDAAEKAALALWDGASSVYAAIDTITGAIEAVIPGFPNLKQALYDAIDDVSAFTVNTFNGAKSAFEGLTESAASLFTEFTNLVNKIPAELGPKIGLVLPSLPDADDWLGFINTLASKLDATVEGGFAFLAQAAETAYNTAANAVNSVDFSTQLKVDAEISGYAGVLVDFRLDGGSVDTDVKYVFSSKTQYNQTTDMLAITPTLVNVTSGEEIAFSTASPNVTITAKLLYDVAAALDVYLNGSMVLAGKNFSLGDGINFSPIFTTSGSNMQFNVLDSTKQILDLTGFPLKNLENLGVTMTDEIVPYNEMFVGLETDPIGTPGEVTLFAFDSSTGDLSVPFYSTNIYEVASDKLSDLVSKLTEGMIEKLEVALPSIKTEGTYVSEEALLDEYLSSPEYVFNKLLDPNYKPADQSFGQNINDYYYDETLKTINLDQITSIFENATISLGAEIEALLDIDYLEAQGYTNVRNYLAGADIGAIIRDVAANFATNAFDLFKETLDGKHTTDAFVIVDMTHGESDALFHFNTFNFNSDDLINDPTNPDSWPNPLLPYQDPDISADTAAFGLYVASGESEPMYKITLDVDEMVALILRKVILAVTGVELPDSVSPFKMGASLDDILSLAEVDAATRTEVKKYINVGMTVERMDYDVTSSIDFSQDFTLTVDDMTYQLTFTEGNNPVTETFKASDADKIIIANASKYDVNEDGKIEYDLQIVPTAMFSNDTELGYNYGLSLDFLTTALKATIGLPLKDLLDISMLPNLIFDLLDYNIGPVLAIDAEINGLDIDVYESRFEMGIGDVTLADGIDIALIGVQAQEVSQALVA